MPHVLVWDIETVPDISGYAAANDLFDKTVDEVREAMGDKFPKHIYHSIVCIGALIAPFLTVAVGWLSRWGHRM